MEDAAIAYGFNNINKVYPNICTIASEQLQNRFSDKIRNYIAQCGFVETLSFVVCSMDDLVNKMLNSRNDNIVKIDSNYELNVFIK